MPASHTTSVLAILVLIASAAPLGAQDAAAPFDVAATGSFLARSAAPLGPPASTSETDSSAVPLSENAWDFGNPNSIPGFGSLPPGYDSRAVMPQISGN